MKKRNWLGDFSCRFCSNDESIGHMFFDCVAAGYVWSVVSHLLGAKVRLSCYLLGNLEMPACFEHKLISDPIDLICRACSFLRYWSELQDKNRILAFRRWSFRMLLMGRGVA